MTTRQELVAECYSLGTRCANVFRDCELYVSSLRRIYQVDDVKVRADEIADVIGPEAVAAFDDGFAAILPPFGEPIV